MVEQKNGFVLRAILSGSCTNLGPIHKVSCHSSQLMISSSSDPVVLLIHSLILFALSDKLTSTKKWNELGFRQPLCTYRLNWAWRTSWGWWDDWDDTVLQTQDSKFEPWRSEAEHATSRSQRLPTILTLTRGWGRNIFYFFQTADTGNRTPNSGVKGSGANHYRRVPAQLTCTASPKSDV